MATKGGKDRRRTKVVIDFGRISNDEFDGDKPLRVATVRGGEIIDQIEVTPGEQDDPRSFEVELDLGEDVDGMFGATVVVAPADDERNLLSERVAKTYVAGRDSVVDAGTILVQPGIYKWWRWCWFPKTYRVTGRVVRHDGDCLHPIGGAIVELFDVDYCWWWYGEDMITTGVTDADGYFDIEFKWCRPLYCIWPVYPPLLVDWDIRERFRERLERLPIPWPDPPDPWTLEQTLVDAGIAIPRARPRRGEAVVAPRLRTAAAVAGDQFQPRRRAARSVGFAADVDVAAPQVQIADLFDNLVIWPGCDDPCDWYPDIRIRVTQSQPGGDVEIYRDSFFDIHWNVKDDLLDLELEADDDAIVGDDCAGEPLLGNCMLLERVGNYGMPAIYQPDIVSTPICGSAPYGTTPTAPALPNPVGDPTLLGRTVSQHRAWCLTPSVFGEFGKASNVDYYQIQRAKWTPADLAAFTLDCSHRPAEASWQTLSAASGLRAFSRSYATLETLFLGLTYYAWHSEGFSPHTFGGVPNVYKSRQRFEQEWVAAHGGDVPAPDFPEGWRWNTSAKTLLFSIDTSAWQDGLYSFRLIGYTKTGDMLSPVDQGLNAGPGVDGVMRRCGGTDAPIVEELLTLYVDQQLKPDCEIVSFTKNGTTPIGECEMIILDTADWVDIEYRAQDTHGNLAAYQVRLRRGSGPNHNIRGTVLSPTVTISGTDPEGPAYAQARVQTPPATPPNWYGGTWTASVPYSAFVALGGSCAYNLALDAWNRHTNGWSSGPGWGAVHCDDDVAFTVVLSGDKETFCEQLGCCEE